MIFSPLICLILTNVSKHGNRMLNCSSRSPPSGPIFIGDYLNRPCAIYYMNPRNTAIFSLIILLFGHFFIFTTLFILGLKIFATLLVFLFMCSILLLTLCWWACNQVFWNSFSPCDRLAFLFLFYFLFTFFIFYFFFFFSFSFQIHLMIGHFKPKQLLSDILPLKVSSWWKLMRSHLSYWSSKLTSSICFAM